MTSLLLRLFVKDYENTESVAVHSAIGRLAGFTGIICNLLLFLGKLTVGWLANSVSIIADAINNLSDASSSVVTLLGFKMAQQPADAEHPYGHARYEYLSGLVVAALILIIGFDLAKSSFQKILHPEAVEFSAATFIVLVLSIAVKLWMAGFFRSLGNRIHSTTLQATSVDSRNDVVASTAVLLGCAVGYFFHVNIDGIIGLAVAVFILYSGVDIARETISPLLGKQADPELIDRITQLVLSHEKILGIHDLLVHDYGPGQCFATVHAELSAEEDPLECHDIIDDIERDALEQMNVHLVIHYDPVVLNDEEWNTMREIMDEIIVKVDPKLSMHDFRVVRSSKKTKLMFDLAVPYSMRSRHREIKAQIDALLAERGKDYKTVISFDETA
ncbi:MAG TPA: cation diffusion facilitator family transporter [Candidatus Anaerobutyricum stercoripullorum]|uniref:Cation diffusion facilitator family transporter n=1 Tax=Candidatus Anaerobutyricum stercoripullorum TaxID=2838456 RepID=A0A9D2BDT1_9FIRM|nr:cation diffusion facilitator family transporter [Candidatus Anaerobutyricum stercoripullorum]